MSIHYMNKVTSAPAIDHEEIATPLAAAIAYQKRNWRVLPVEHKSKTCHIPGWQNYKVDELDLSTIFADPKNVGILLGASNLTDVDIDSPHAAPFLSWLPPTYARWGRPGNPNSHHLYAGTCPMRSVKNSQGVIIEIRSHGCYAVMPPSVHPNGESYAWEAEGEPGVGDGLENAVSRIAVAATLLPAWLPGVRHQLALAIAGLLLKAGWSTDDVLDLVAAVAKAANDHEVVDRKLAVQTTADKYKAGASVAGYSRLVELLGKQDADAISSWVSGDVIDFADLASSAKSVKEKRHVAQELRKDLTSRGVFYRTRGIAELLYFNKPERELYALGSVEFRALCGELYGINGKEPVWSYVEEALQQHCLRQGELTESFQFARYQDQKLYIHAGGHRVFKLDGHDIIEIDNGDDGVLFKSDPSLVPIHPDYVYSGSPVRDHLVNGANAVDPDRLALYEIFIYSHFFESRLTTKPIVLFTGPKGSGKTSAGRALKRALHGPTANVNNGMASKEDAFWAGVSHNSLVVIDNVDTLVPWLADAIAVVATGAKYQRRKLYETNTSVEYQPRCFVIVTSRNPQSFTRDDVVDRLLLVEVARRKNFIEESTLLAHIDANRPKIWGELLTHLNKMVAALMQPIDQSPLAHRLADWARLAIVFAPLLGIVDIEQKLNAMETSKVEFALDDNPLVQALDDWLEANPQSDYIASGDLFKAILKSCEAKGEKFSIKDARAFGIQLKHLRSELESRYLIEDKVGPSNKKLYRFSKLTANPDQQLPGQEMQDPLSQL
ncbi:MAG: bifunctional DNA primase/polymerase [Thiobacillaceae bacterium]